MTMPNATPTKFSPPGVVNLPPTGPSAPEQAIGAHDSGRLDKANELQAVGDGFISRDHNSKDFGTDRTVELIRQAMAAMKKQYPKATPITIGSVANRTGGRMTTLDGKSAHASHQTGLDADIGFPSTKADPGLWTACPTVQKTVKNHDGSTHTVTVCRDGGKISDNFDDKRFWLLIEEMTCAKGKPVVVMFLDKEIKKHMCEYAKQNSNENLNDHSSCAFRALRVLRNESGHYNHVHVRLQCPGNPGCIPSELTMADATGC